MRELPGKPPNLASLTPGQPTTPTAKQNWGRGGGEVLCRVGDNWERLPGVIRQSVPIIERIRAYAQCSLHRPGLRVLLLSFSPMNPSRPR